MQAEGTACDPWPAKSIVDRDVARAGYRRQIGRARAAIIGAVDESRTLRRVQFDRAVRRLALAASRGKLLRNQQRRTALDIDREYRPRCLLRIGERRTEVGATSNQHPLRVEDMAWARLHQEFRIAGDRAAGVEHTDLLHSRYSGKANGDYARLQFISRCCSVTCVGDKPA